MSVSTSSSSLLRTGIQVDHPWRHILGIFGVQPADIDVPDQERFHVKFGFSCGSIDEADRAWAWLWTNCRYLRADLVRGSGSGLCACEWQDLRNEYDYEHIAPNKANSIDCAR
jgi:hypothetical protein